MAVKVTNFEESPGMTPTDTWKILDRSKEGSRCSMTLVFEWYWKFREGREEVTDDKRPEMPSDGHKNVRKGLESFPGPA